MIVKITDSIKIEEKNEEKRWLVFCPSPDSNKSPDIFFRTTKRNKFVSNHHSNSSLSLSSYLPLPRSYHFCPATLEQKKRRRFDSIRKVDIVIVWNLIAEEERCLEEASRCSPFRAFLHRASILVDQRWRDLDGGRQGNVINFERDFYCGRGGGVRVRLNVWRFIGSLKSFTATGKFYMVVQ